MIKYLINNSPKISNKSYLNTSPFIYYNSFFRFYSSGGGFNNKYNNNNNNNNNINNYNNSSNNNINRNNNSSSNNRTNNSNNNYNNNKYNSFNNTNNINNNNNSINNKFNNNNVNNNKYNNNNNLNNSNNVNNNNILDNDFESETIIDGYNGNGDVEIENIEAKEKEDLFSRYENRTFFEKVEIPEKTLSITYKYARSSGPGGQNVNKVNTKCELRVDLNAANWIPTWVKDNIVKSYNKLVNKENILIINSTRHRTQHHNKKDALDKLRHVLNTCSFKPKVRIATEIPQYAKEERLHDKKIKHELKKQRKKKQIHEYFQDY